MVKCRWTDKHNFFNKVQVIFHLYKLVYLHVNAVHMCLEKLLAFALNIKTILL
jgi:hypothetical protein